MHLQRSKIHLIRLCSEIIKSDGIFSSLFIERFSD